MTPCANCGEGLITDARYCPSCGQSVEQAATPTPPVGALPEAYIGGFFGLARRRGLNFEKDYGLFLTTSKIIVLDTKSMPKEGWPWMERFLEAPVRRKDDKLTIEVKDFDALKKTAEIPKEQIAGIGLKRPGEFFEKGYLQIRLNSGKTLSFVVMEGPEGIQDFDAASDLLEEFMPGVLRLVGSDALSKRATTRKEIIFFGLLVVLVVVILLLLYTGIIPIM